MITSTPRLEQTANYRAVTKDQRYDLRIARTGSGEIGELIDGFTELLTELQSRDSQLTRQPEALELTVTTRTTTRRPRLLLACTVPRAPSPELTLEARGDGPPARPVRTWQWNDGNGLTIRQMVRQS